MAINNFMRLVIVFCFATIFISAIAIVKNLHHDFPRDSSNLRHAHSATEIQNTVLLRLQKYATQAKAYTAKNDFNERYCFLIDMNIPSGSNRFFVYDLQQDSILLAGLVTHGSGIDNLSDTMTYSNELGSNCTSAGKYRIGKPYHGKFGLAYKLYGLDNTNSNAFKRFVVLHAHPAVPDHEVYPQRICKSWGCPTVSPRFLDQLKIYPDRSGKPLLLWILK